jgi:general secretion pathway protein M
MTSTFSTWQAQALILWQQRSARERLLLSAGAALMALILVWRVGLAPALRTWQEAPIKQAQLDKQTQHMQELQIQSQRLQQAQAISRNDAMQWLETHLSELGPNAKLSLQGEHMSLSLQAAPADHLANWLALAREQAHVRPAQAQLQQAGTPPAATSADNTVVWNGNLLLRLP